MERHVSQSLGQTFQNADGDQGGSTFGSGGVDHFLLMTRLGVWDFGVNALIPHRRGRNHALMLGWGCGPLLVIGSGWVLALRDGLPQPCRMHHRLERQGPSEARSRSP
jgi:hypothetical protein